MGSNGLQNEFEEFIQNIIQQVSEEIYLEDLKKIYDSYQECLKGMQSQTKKLSENAVQMKEERQNAAEDLNAMKTEMEESTERVEKALDIFYNGYKEILRQYEEKIVFLNDKERQDYIKQFQSVIVETREKEKRELEDSFKQWEDKIQKLTGTIATAESIYQVTDELEQVRETIKNTTDLKYLEKLTDFENKLKDAGLRERKDMENKVKAVFQAESDKTKQMLQGYQKSLTEVTAKTMTRKDMEEFQKNLSRYTNAIQSIADKRYEEALKKFEEKLFQMGSQQFSNYIRKLNESTVKVSDLEIFLGQVRLLEESMRQGVKKSEEEYKQIFSNFRTDVQKVNQETRNEFMKSLTDLFGQQHDRMKQSIDQHIQALDNFKREQKELLQCVEMIRDLAQKNHSNLNLVARVIAGISQKEDAVMEKLERTSEAIEDNTRQLDYTVKIVEDGTKQLKNTSKQIEEHGKLLEQMAKQNDSGVRQMQTAARKLDHRTDELSEQMEEIIKNGKNQNIVLQAILGDNPNWKIDVFDRFEINLVYVILIMLAWICIRVA